MVQESFGFGMQRPRFFMDRSGSPERRLPELEGQDCVPPEPKRPKLPSLASVVVEALKVDSLQKLCSSLEPVLRRVVSEEVERALERMGHAKFGLRTSPPKRIEGPDGRNLQLHFRTRLSLPLFTGGKVEGEQGATIHVVLLDANTGNVVTSGTESNARLDVVALEGDFNNQNDDDWAEEEFESHVVRERDGKRPLLTGDLQMSLKEGVGTLGEIIFTDNSSWIRSRKFRLGLKVASGFCEGLRIREAKTEAFSVKDHRGELYKKHFPPALKDEVWRLEKIGKDGSFHKRLNKSGIYTVEDFLRILVRDPQRLRKILGSSMSNKMWEVLVEHAKTCILNGKHYVYYSDITKSIGAIFNNIYEFTGLLTDEKFYSAESLCDSQKVLADALVKRAYDNWMHVIEYDGKALLNFVKNKKTSTSSNESSVISNNYTTYNQAVGHHMFARAPEQPTAGAILAVRGAAVSCAHAGNQVTKYSSVDRGIDSNGHSQFDSSSLSSHDRFISFEQTQAKRNNNAVLPVVPVEPVGISFQPMDQPALTTSNNFYDDWSGPREHRSVEHSLSEEIHARSHETLENEDMQHLLQVFSMSGSPFPSDDIYDFSTYMPSPCVNFHFEEQRSRSSGRAFVGWLKIKAAMRWGIFVRKKAAERRAMLVELHT